MPLSLHVSIDRFKPAIQSLMNINIDIEIPAVIDNFGRFVLPFYKTFTLNKFEFFKGPKSTIISKMAIKYPPADICISKRFRGDPKGSR